LQNPAKRCAKCNQNRYFIRSSSSKINSKKKILNSNREKIGIFRVQQKQHQIKNGNDQNCFGASSGVLRQFWLFSQVSIGQTSNIDCTDRVLRDKIRAETTSKLGHDPKADE
jgi:hypothetical protein